MIRSKHAADIQLLSIIFTSIELPRYVDQIQPVIEVEAVTIQREVTAAGCITNTTLTLDDLRCERRGTPSFSRFGHETGC
jgi:hypothetical protein